ncbi:MAG: DUF4157 domain-containing protein [Ferruginibacter sp.]
MDKLTLQNITIKENAWIAKLAAARLKSSSMAIVLGKTIYLYGTTRNDFLQNTRWVKHEICHVQQFHREGFLLFLIKYLWESLRHGYYNNKYEVEARQAEEKGLGV